LIRTGSRRSLMQREGAFPPAAAQTSVVTDLPDHARAGDLDEGATAGGDEFRGSVALYC
jgi:hypothetical protein